MRIYFLNFYFNANEKKLDKKISYFAKLHVFLNVLKCLQMICKSFAVQTFSNQFKSVYVKLINWLIFSHSALGFIVFHDNLKTNPFTQYSFYEHLPFTLDFPLSFSLPLFLFFSLSFLPFFFLFSLFLFRRLLLCALRSIPTLLINKSYPEFLLLVVSFEKLTSYLTAGTQRRRTRTSAVFHSLVFTHAEINFVHFPFPVAHRRRGHRDKAALSLRHAY